MHALFLVSYDITSPKRLLRLHRALKKVALPIEYSVFLGSFTAAGLGQLRATITTIIDPATDDVRIYPLPVNGWRRALGRAAFPAGILFTLASREFASDGSPRLPTAPADQLSAPGNQQMPEKRCASMRAGMPSGIQLID